MSIVILVVVLALALVGNARGAPDRADGRATRQGVLRAVVKLMTPFEFSVDAGSLCSGIMLNQQGYILTNFHCVGYGIQGERDRELERSGLRPGDLFNRQGVSTVAITGDPRRLPAPTYQARVMVTDPDLNLAVLKITSYVNSNQPLPRLLPVVSLPLGDSDQVKEMDGIVVIGYPGITSQTVTAVEGQIAGILDAEKDGAADWFTTEALVNQGASGGAVVNARGETIGIATDRAQERGQIVSRLRPSNRAVALIQRAMKAGDSVTTVGDAAIGSAAGVGAGQNIGALSFGAQFKNGSITNPTAAFASATNEVQAAVPYQAMRDGQRWSHAWRLDGKTIAGGSDLKWQYGATGVLSISLNGKKGLPDGVYTLQIFLNDVLAQQGNFTIGKATFVNVPQKPTREEDDTRVTITGTLIDHSTRRPIQGAAIAFLRAGKTVRDFEADMSKGKTETVLSYGVANASGIFTADTPLPRGATYSVIVSAHGYQRIAANAALEITGDDPDVVELEPIGLDRR